MAASRAEPASTSAGSGWPLSAGIGCYLIWGFVPLVFQLIGHMGVGPWELLAQRTFWSIPAAGLFVLLAGQARQVGAVFRNPRIFGWLCVSSLLIACNWSTFIWSVDAGRLLETSLGYYITPLVNMAAGAILFRERIGTLGKVATGLAAIGVVVQGIALGHLPWISLVLAASFGAYGIVRKQVQADAQTGLLVECLFVGLPGLAYVIWLESHGLGHFSDPTAAAWLIACGPITAVPLVLFSWSARRIPLSAMGFLQFISPTISFIIGLVEGEAFTPLRAVSFAFIWAGVGVFAWGAWKRSRQLARAAAEAAETAAA